MPIWLRRRAQDSFEAPLQLTARKGECWEMRSLGVITAPRQGWDPQRAPPCQPCPPTSQAGQPGGLGITGGRGQRPEHQGAEQHKASPAHTTRAGRGSGHPSGAFPPQTPSLLIAAAAQKPLPQQDRPHVGQTHGVPTSLPAACGRGSWRGAAGDGKQRAARPRSPRAPLIKGFPAAAGRPRNDISLSEHSDLEKQEGEARGAARSRCLPRPGRSWAVPGAAGWGRALLSGEGKNNLELGCLDAQPHGVVLGARGRQSRAGTSVCT